MGKALLLIVAPLIVIAIFVTLFSQSHNKARELKDSKGEDSLEYTKEIAKGRMYLASALGILAVLFGVGMVVNRVKR